MIRLRRVFRILLAAGLVVLALGITAIAVLHSRSFHQYVLAKLKEEASKSTGGRVEIGDFQLHWSGLRVDLYQLVLHGSEAASQPPLLQVDHLLAGLKIMSLWRRKIGFYKIVVDRPSIHLSVDQNGHSNLPQAPPSAPGSASTNVFALAINDFVVNRGELNYNDRHVPLDGEVHDLHAQVSFDSAKSEYDGTLGYRDGRIHFGTFNPMQTGLQVHFGARPSGLSVNPLVLTAGSSTTTVQGQLHDYSNPSVDGSYEANLSTVELARILNASAVPAGLVNLRGTLHYQNHSDQPLMNNLSLSGRLRSSLLALDLPQAHADVRDLTGEYQLSGGTLEVRNVKADVLGGKVAGNLTLTHMSARPVGRVAAALSDITLEAVTAALNTQPLERADITGRLNGTVEGSWEASGQKLKVRADATLAGSAPLGPAAGGGTNAIPLQGTLHASYDGAAGTITLSNTNLATPHLTVKLDGSTGKQSSLAIQAQSDDLHEVDQLMLVARRGMAKGRTSAPTPTAPLGIGGSASFTGQLSGSTSDLHLTGHLSSTKLQYRGATMNEFKLNLALSPSGATVSQGELRIGAGGKVQFDAGAVLKNWAYEPQYPVHLNLTATRIAVAPLAQLANLHYPISGRLGARISIHGSQSHVAGQGSVTLAPASAWGQPIQNLSIQVQGAGSTIQSTLQLSTPAGSASGKLTYDFHTQAYDAQFNIPSLQLERLEAVRGKRVQVAGTASASFAGRGTLQDPQLTATIQAPKLLIGQQALDGLVLHTDVAHQQAAFTLDSAAKGASIQARGAVTLNADYSTQANLDVRNIQLATVLPAFLPQIPPELRGQAELHGSLHGPLLHWQQIEAEVEIPTLNLSYRSLQIGNASPIRAVYRGGVLSLEKCELKGTGTDLQVQATVPLENARSLQATATGEVDLHLVQLFYPDFNTSGQLRLEVNAQGTFSHPAVTGTVRLENVAFKPPSAPLGVQNVNATIAVKNGRVDIQSLSGEVGGGTLSAEGFAIYQPALQFNLALTAQQVRLRYPVGTRAILDGKLALTGSGGSALLSGQVMIDGLSLTKEFDLSTFADQFTGIAEPAAGPTFAQDIKLDVSLKSASEMALTSSKLSVQGSADLMVRGTVDDPVILGRTDITGGEVFFNGNRYMVESGVIQFINPVETEPVVNIRGTTIINQFNLTMNFVGPIDRMRTTYTSDPPLAPVDIINLIATGQTTQAASTTSNSPESVVAGQLTNQLSSRVGKLAGITSLTIDPQVGGAQGNGVGRLAVQQRVTRNLFFTFSTDLATSTGTIVQVEYQATKRMALSTIRDQNGGYTVEVKVHKRF
jgi:translocation and assembly module TamB